MQDRNDTGENEKGPAFHRILLYLLCLLAGLLVGYPLFAGTSCADFIKQSLSPEHAASPPMAIGAREPSIEKNECDILSFRAYALMFTAGKNPQLSIGDKQTVSRINKAIMNSRPSASAESQQSAGARKYLLQVEKTSANSSKRKIWVHGNDIEIDVDGNKIRYCDDGSLSRIMEGLFKPVLPELESTGNR